MKDRDRQEDKVEESRRERKGQVGNSIDRLEDALRF